MLSCLGTKGLGAFKGFLRDILFFFSSDGHIRSHLKNVYACLSMSILSAAAGAYTHVFTSLLRGGGLLYTLASLGMLFGLYSTPGNLGSQP